MHAHTFQAGQSSFGKKQDKKLEGFSTTQAREIKTRTNKNNDPNALVEDEYIHNLQQQIYFLELETKLLKEKERERGGFFMDADAMMINENMFSLKGKYKQMEQDLESKVTEFTEENKDLATKNASLQKNLTRAIKEREDAEVFRNKCIASYDKELEKIKRALELATNRRDEAVRKSADMAKEKEMAFMMANKLMLDKQGLEFTRKDVINRMREMDTHRERIRKEKDETIQTLKDKIEDYEREKAENIKLQELTINNKKLKEENDELELDKEEYHINIKTMEYEKDLYDKQSAQLNKELKQYKQQLEELKSNMEKEREYQEAQLMEKLAQKKSKELKLAKVGLDEARKECIHNQSNCKVKIEENKRLWEEKNKLHHEFAELEKQTADLEKEDHELGEKQNELDPEHHDSSKKYNDTETQNREDIHNLEKSLTETRSLFAENSDLKSRIDYLYMRLDKTDRLKGIDVNELRSLITSNTQVNDTTSTLVGRWDSIAKFLRNEEQAERMI